MTLAVEHDARPALRGQDRFTWTYTLWTAVVALLVYCSEELDRTFHLYLFLIPILGIPSLVVLIALIVSLGVNLVKGHWRRALSIVMAPVLVVSALVVTLKAGLNEDWVRFEIAKPYYLRE